MCYYILYVRLVSAYVHVHLYVCGCPESISHLNNNNNNNLVKAVDSCLTNRCAIPRAKNLAGELTSNNITTSSIFFLGNYLHLHEILGDIFFFPLQFFVGLLLDKQPFLHLQHEVGIQ